MTSAMTMIYIWKLALIFALLKSISVDWIEARRQNSTPQRIDAPRSDISETIRPFYDLNQNIHNFYPTIPLDHLQIFIPRFNRPTVYFRSPSVVGISELYRLPESKRQVRYRQCYFNPISCFKK